MGDSTCVLLFVSCLVTVVLQLTHGASLYRRDIIPRGFGPGMMSPCPMMDCPVDSFGPCPDEEYHVYKHRMIGGFCCPVCPACIPISIAWVDCSTQTTEEPETTEVPTKVPAPEHTEVPAGGKGVTAGKGKQSPNDVTKATHVDEDDLETTNMVSTVASKKDSMESQPMKTLKSFGQRFLALFRRKDHEETTPSTTVVSEFTVHKLDDVGGAGNMDINTEVQNDESSEEEEEEEEEEDSRKEEREDDVTTTEKTESTEAPAGGPPDGMARDIVECPTPDCLEVACGAWNQQATWITFQGQACPGCPRCI